jgi:hypothetical protein
MVPGQTQKIGWKENEHSKIGYMIKSLKEALMEPRRPDILL